jgi:hypothetical protein
MRNNKKLYKYITLKLIMFIDTRSKGEDNFIFPEDKRIEAYKRFLENSSNDEYLFNEKGIFKIGFFGKKK